MAFASLLTLLDDIASVLDDVALMTKLAARKTAGVVGDDLALNANQVAGVNKERELPIILAVAKGSVINKVILIPIALILAIFIPVLINPLLMIGGAYLCFEGVEKLLHRFLNQEQSHQQTELQRNNGEDEADKIKGAIRTDFILSAEIIIIALGAIKDSELIVKILALSAVGIGMTVFVYGIVMLIVKADDFGAYLLTKNTSITNAIGHSLLWLMPWLMRILSIVGTVAMFLVGGGIFSHNVPMLHDWLHQHHWETGLMEMIINFVIGIIIGLMVCAIVLPIMSWWQKHQIHS